MYGLQPVASPFAMPTCLTAPPSPSPRSLGVSRLPPKGDPSERKCRPTGAPGNGAQLTVLSWRDSGPPGPIPLRGMRDPMSRCPLSRDASTADSGLAGSRSYVPRTSTKRAIRRPSLMSLGMSLGHRSADRFRTLGRTSSQGRSPFGGLSARGRYNTKTLLFLLLVTLACPAHDCAPVQRPKSPGFHLRF